ncbi:MAG: hypothetical protein GY850_34700, partial [bacterium]|nr:hypothetical protein [bacterium]
MINKKAPFNRIKDQHGVSIILAVIALMMLSALCMGILSITTTGSLTAANMHNHTYALYLAEAGVERAIHAIKNASSSGGATVTAAADPFYQYEHTYDGHISVSSPDKAWDYDEENHHCLAGDIEWGPGTSDDEENSFELQNETGVTVSHFVDFDDAILQGSTLTGPVTVVVRN